MAFGGFTTELFEAYTPEKWSSNAYNLQRMRAKETLDAVAHELATRLEGRLGTLQRASSDQIPTILNQKKVSAQWAYWTRDTEEKKALSVLFEKLRLDGSLLMTTANHDKHALIGLVAEHTGLKATFRVASEAQVDRQNLAAKLAKDPYHKPFLGLLNELPAGFELATDADDVGEPFSATDIQRLSVADIQSLVEYLGRRKGSLAIRKRWSRNEAVEAGEEILAPLLRCFEVLEPIYRFCAWSRSNDHTEVGVQLQQIEAKRHAQALAFEAGQEVRIIGGMFKGKLGRVEAIDAKAKVRVRVGKMSVMVSGYELTFAK